MSQQQQPAQSQQYSQQGGGGQTSGSMGDQQIGGQQSSATSGPVGRRFSTRSYLPEQVRTTSIGLLNQCLADLTAVNMQLKAAHWNVKGVEFYQLHELFEDLVETFEAHIDTVAERATALGGQALGTPRDVVQHCTVPPYSNDVVQGRAVLAQIADSLAALDSAMYQQIQTASQQEDHDTADLLNEVSRDVSKALWFVEAHLQGQEAGTAGFRTANFSGSRPSTDSQ